MPGSNAAIQTANPTVSIVICTDDRGAAVANTLRCLERLDGPPIEVCVVCGPNDAGTLQALQPWHGAIKIAHNSEKNISSSRNIGLGIAAGSIIAFIDDDAFPEPAWLPELLECFDGPKVGGAGGIVLDHTGTFPQYLYSSANRLGHAYTRGAAPFAPYNFPLSFNFPYLQGTNCAFRREALIEIGGFDEEYEYFLDETDVCCRLNDAGWRLRQTATAIVHHKFLPSSIRNAARVTHSRYSIMKNKLYFSLQNNRGHYTESDAMMDMLEFIKFNEASLRRHIRWHGLSSFVLDTFLIDAKHAVETGLARGRGARMLPARHRLVQPPAFLAFPQRRPLHDRQTYVFVSATDKWSLDAARDASAQGHHVHVLTLAGGHDRIDFEDGLWVYRFAPRWSRIPLGLPREAALLAAFGHVRARTPAIVLRPAPDDAEAEDFLARHGERLSFSQVGYIAGL